MPPQKRATSAPQERATLATARGCCPSAALRSDATWPLGVADADLLPGGDPLGPKTNGILNVGMKVVERRGPGGEVQWCTLTAPR